MVELPEHLPPLAPASPTPKWVPAPPAGAGPAGKPPMGPPPGQSHPQAGTLTLIRGGAGQQTACGTLPRLALPMAPAPAGLSPMAPIMVGWLDPTSARTRALGL